MQIWEEFLRKQEAEIGKVTVGKWLTSLKVLKFDACNLYLEAKDRFHLNWFEEHIRPKIKQCLVNNNNHPIQVHLAVANQPTREKKGRYKQAKAPPEPLTIFRFDKLDPSNRLEHFISSEKNLVVYKLLAQMTGLSSGTPELATFNPLYIYGPSGVGKTHLLMSVTHALKEKGYRPLFLSSETFTDHVVNAIRCSEMHQFRNKYRSADVLIIDDVHRFARKGATQEELFHTFNALHLEGKQVVLSANCAPSALQFIEPRLVSRFEWGIVLPLEEATLEEKRAILAKKMELMNFQLHPKVVQFLLETFTSTTTALCRAFQAIILKEHLSEKRGHIPPDMLTIPIVKKRLEALIRDEEASALTPEKFMVMTAEHFGITKENILSKAQSRDCVIPRQIAMYLCRKQLKIPFIQLGDLFHRDHSTVMSGVKNIQKKLDAKDKEMSALIESISEKARAASLKLE